MNEDQEMVEAGKLKITSLEEILNTLKLQTFCTDDQNVQLKSIQKYITTEKRRYNWYLQQAQIGGPLPVCPFEDLQPICEKLVQVLLLKLQIAKQNLSLFNGDHSEPLFNEYKQIFDTSLQALATFIKSCLVIEKQPPPIVVKSNKVLRVTLRLLLGKSFLTDISPLSSNLAKVTCSLLLEKEARELYDKSITNTRYEISKESILKKDMAFQENDNILRIKETKLGLQPSKKNTMTGEKVADQKSCFVFQTSIKIEGEIFLIEVMSVPFVVISKTDYEREAVEATVFWDNAFASEDRQPFEVPDAVPFRQFVEALNMRWTQANDRPLTENEIHYLETKFFANVSNQNDVLHLVTKATFHKVNLPRCGFTFWQWFYEIMTMVNKFVKDEWKNGCIEGFISRCVAEQALMLHPGGTFLLRFPESILGCISVAYKNYLSECQSTEPYMREGLQTIVRSLREISEYKNLYSTKTENSLTPKEHILLLPQAETEERRSKLAGYPVRKKTRHEIVDDRCSASSPMSTSTTPDDLSSLSASDQSPFGQISEDAASPWQFSLDEDPFLPQANIETSKCLTPLANSFFF